MRLYPNQLNQQLNQQLAPFYLIFGEELFLLNQAAKQIKHAAKQQGFDEIIRFAASAQFDWQELTQEYHSLSLFAARKIIEVELGDAKPNAVASKLIQALSADPNPDCILILKGNKSGNEIQRTAWFKALDKEGIFIPCYPIQGKQLDTWLKTEISSKKLDLTEQACQLLLDYNQGNLFAISQELEKLSLLALSGTIDLDTLTPHLLNQSRFDVFDLSDALLKGDANTITRILAKLKQENVEPTIILWALTRECEKLLSLKQKLQQRHSIQDAFNALKIWKNKQAITELAIHRLSLQQLENITNKLAEFDFAYKQHLQVDTFQHLLHLALLFVDDMPFLPPFNAKVEQYL